MYNSVPQTIKAKNQTASHGQKTHAGRISVSELPAGIHHKTWALLKGIQEHLYMFYINRRSTELS